MIPEVNKTYNYFDDGKITHGRIQKVEIKQIIPFDKIDAGTMFLWEVEIEECNWLYNKQTDYFVEAYLPEVTETIMFVRCINNGWFSLGWWAGRLDIDGKLTKQLNEIS